MRNYRQDNNNAIDKFIEKLRREPIANIPLKDLVKPKGYAEKIVQNLRVTRVQLRKIYSEMKYIFERVRKKGRLDEETEVKFYMLYPVLEYQKNRRVIDEKFVRLMDALLENLERNPTKENFEQAERFLIALVAYMKREA